MEVGSEKFICLRKRKERRAEMAKESGGGGRRT